MDLSGVGYAKQSPEGDRDLNAPQPTPHTRRRESKAHPPPWAGVVKTTEPRVRAFSAVNRQPERGTGRRKQPNRMVVVGPLGRRDTPATENPQKTVAGNRRGAIHADEQQAIREFESRGRHSHETSAEQARGFWHIGSVNPLTRTNNALA